MNVRKRREGIPLYEDKGCELSSSCLNCPLPTCVDGQPWGRQNFLKRKRAERMMELKRDGKSVQEIGCIFEVNPRTVYRGLMAVQGRTRKARTN